MRDAWLVAQLIKRALQARRTPLGALQALPGPSPLLQPTCLWQTQCCSCTACPALQPRAALLLGLGLWEAQSRDLDQAP